MKVSESLFPYEGLLDFRDFQDSKGVTHKFVSSDDFWIASYCVDRTRAEINYSIMVEEGAGDSPDSDVFAQDGRIWVKWDSEISDLSLLFVYAVQEGDPIDDEAYYDAQAEEINHYLIPDLVAEAMDIEDDFGIAASDVYDTTDDYVEKINQLSLLESSGFEVVFEGPEGDSAYATSRDRNASLNQFLASMFDNDLLAPTKEIMSAYCDCIINFNNDAERTELLLSRPFGFHKGAVISIIDKAAANFTDSLADIDTATIKNIIANGDATEILEKAGYQRKPSHMQHV